MTLDKQTLFFFPLQQQAQLPRTLSGCLCNKFPAYRALLITVSVHLHLVTRLRVSESKFSSGCISGENYLSVKAVHMPSEVSHRDKQLMEPSVRTSTKGLAVAGGADLHLCASLLV